MAGVNLPNVDGMTTMDELKNALGKMTKELTWLLQNLDTRNVNELDAEVIIAGSITAGKLAANSVETENLVAGSVQTDKLAAGAVTADKITVDELSAITANLGHIISGLIESVQIFGSYIATRNGAYPRAELNDDGDLIAVYTDADTHLKIVPGISGAPTIAIEEGGVLRLFLGPAFGLPFINGPSGLTVGSSSGTLQLVCGVGVLDYINIPGFGQLYSSAESQTLADALASKANTGVSTDSASGGSHNHGIPDGTVLMVSGGGTVTWNSYSGFTHSHTQN